MLKWTRRLRIGTGLVLLAVLLSAPVGLVQAALSWHTETVDTVGTRVAETSLALDSAGRPHISYRGNSGGGLMYARYDGTTWDIESVDSGFDIGEFSSLALTGDDLPRISYFDRGNSALKYATYDGTEWTIETIDNAGEVGPYTSLELDSAGRPHISYYDYGETDLKYATHDGTSWTTEIVNNTGFAGSYTSLALDSVGQPHISYYDLLNVDLKYARYDGAGWVITTVDSDGNIGIDTSLVLDSGDDPHISYTGETANELRYATYDGTSWTIEVVDSDGNVGDSNSLALDRDGQPHISYFNVDDRDLKYAHYDGAAWQTEVVDSEGHVGTYTSLALDDVGRPHISYIDYSNRSLKYARGTENQPPVVDASGPYSGAEGSPITLDATVTDPDNDALTISWSYVITSADPGTTCTFGDGSLVETTFTCTDDGTFTVTLEADDGLNPPVSDTASVTINNVAPAITESAASLSGSEATVTVVASDPGANDPLSYAFDCNNDGSYEMDAGSTNSATCALNPQQDGRFTFWIQVSDDDGGIATDIVSVTVATHVCRNNYTGSLRYSAACQDHETAITLPDDGPMEVCASQYTSILRVPMSGACAGHETSYVLPEDGPLNVCINRYTNLLRVVDDLGQCASAEVGKVIAATEVGQAPPPRTW